MTRWRRRLGRIMRNGPSITEGVLTLDGVERAVTIRRDRHGIPHISAHTDGDAWFALGFCQGQDRTFQLEIYRRVVRGTVAELIGRDGLPIDRLSRRIGFTRAAAALEPMLDDDERRGLSAFAAGVTAGSGAGLRRRPLEFVLLRTRPSPHDTNDVLGLGLLQAFALSANWDAELARLAIVRADGVEALRRLDPTYPSWLPVTSPPGTASGEQTRRLAADLEALRGVLGGPASNNWAISATKTATGRPILANDPHLAPGVPPAWYLAHVTTPSWSIAGAVFAGSPVFGAAHNGHVAWGVTAGLVDTTDLFLEELGDDGRSVRRGDLLVAATVHREEIGVRGGDPIVEEVVETDVGPIVGPALVDTDPAVAMAATWLRPERVSSLMDVRSARTIDELRTALAEWHGPSLNVVMADTTGAIGWQLVGQAPVRRFGEGTIPLPAWDPACAWEEGHLPFSAMPHARDPEPGYLATANNRPTTDNDPFLGVDWLDGYRLARIVELLETRHDWDVEATLDMQLDTVALPWRELAVTFRRAARRGRTPVAASLFTDFDGDLRADSPAASVFVLALKDMERRVCEAAAPRSFAAALGRSFTPQPMAQWNLFAFRRTGHLVDLMRSRPEGWFDDWEAVVGDAIATAESTLRARFGPDPSGWAWGRVRPLHLRHALGGRVPLDRIFDLGPYPWSGDFSTISQSGAPPLDPLANPSAIASARVVIDVGEWDSSRVSLPGGQSGHPLSPHYDDLVEPWRSARGVPLWWSEDAVAAATQETLHLVPRRRRRRTTSPRGGPGT